MYLTTIPYRNPNSMVVKTLLLYLLCFASNPPYDKHARLYTCDSFKLLLQPLL